MILFQNLKFIFITLLISGTYSSEVPTSTPTSTLSANSFTLTDTESPERLYLRAYDLTEKFTIFDHREGWELLELAAIRGVDRARFYLGIRYWFLGEMTLSKKFLEKAAATEERASNVLYHNFRFKNDWNCYQDVRCNILIQHWHNPSSNLVDYDSPDQEIPIRQTSSWNNLATEGNGLKSEDYIPIITQHLKDLKGEVPLTIIEDCYEAALKGNCINNLIQIVRDYHFGNKALNIPQNDGQAIRFSLGIFSLFSAQLGAKTIEHEARLHFWSYFTPYTYFEVFQTNPNTDYFCKFIHRKAHKKNESRCPVIIFNNTIRAVMGHYITLFHHESGENDELTENIISLETKIWKLATKINKGMKLNNGIFYITWLQPHYHIGKMIKNDQTLFPLEENRESLLFCPANINAKLAALQKLPQLLEEQLHAIELQQVPLQQKAEVPLSLEKYRICLNNHIFIFTNVIQNIIKFFFETETWRNSLFFVKYNYLIPDY